MPRSREEIDRAEEQIYELRKSVRYDIRELILETIVDKYERGLEYTELDEFQDINSFYNVLFVPEYQRDFTWDEKRQSKFIESIILGLPVPLIFVAENKDSVWEIVDGSQRIRTIYHFVRGELKLQGLQKIDTLNGFFFGDLDKTRQGKLLSTPLRMIVLSEDADDEVKRDMFERINRGSDLLKPMEMRKGDKTGILTQFIYDRCAQHPLFDKLCPIDKFLQNRQEKEELILRYIGLSDKGRYKQFPKKGIAVFLDEYLEAKNKELSDLSSDEVESELKLLYDKFDKMLGFVDQYSTYGFRRTANPQTKRVIFEAISIGVHEALQKKADIIYSKQKWDEMVNSREFAKYYSGNTKLHDPNKLKGRVEFIMNAILDGDESN
ncbi:MAG: DUF262 domain-containing protein [Porphyromonadaceae bacterium]|nr:DUF262 domain-containing protein [Porphyromonadaceae bacterium]